MNARMMLLLPACLLAVPLFAQSESDEIKTQRCLATRLIDSPVVVDDSHILFFMRGNTVYLNRLPEACKGLLKYKTFSYQQIAGRVCESDRINLHSSIDPTIKRPCKIGIFEEIDSRDIPALIESLYSQPSARELPTAEVEDVGDEPEVEEPPPE